MIVATLVRRFRDYATLREVTRIAELPIPPTSG